MAERTAAGHPHALRELAARLRCPACEASPLRPGDGSLSCPAGHAFDLARQGYVTLRSGAQRHHGDDARMVAAREEFLDGGHYRPLSSTIAMLAAEHAPDDNGLVLDLGGGTGYYLAEVLRACPERYGICVEASKPALRRAARAHPAAAAIGADVWAGLPIIDAVADVVLSVFAPRNVAEIERVLAPGGVLLLATPQPAHLAELAGLVGGLGVDPKKPERLAASFSRFDLLASQQVSWRAALRPAEVRAAVVMGPTARHLTDTDLDTRLRGLPALTGITVAVEVSVLRRSAP